ncbi:endolytic transglycosylase MltG [Chromatiaceae bacterium AAb-1]|nr:endolytic transglycosylase MltG [Chromatiaceae bacterium AAb-1]
MLKKIIIAGVTLLVLLALSIFASLQHLQQLSLAFAEPLQRIVPGDNTRSLCRQWQQQQLISSNDCQLLRVYLKFHPELTRLQQGLYRVPDTVTLPELLALFSSGKVAQFSVTFIEGETFSQAIQRLGTAPYLVQDLSLAEPLPVPDWPSEWGEVPADPEALIYPDTYFYTADSKASQIIRRAQQALLGSLANAWDNRQQGLPLQNPYQLLIMASIIEKESRYLPEKPLVSSVFVNRLRKNMRLQTDPTVIYGLEDFNGNITRADLRNPHPYNTYRHHGLPPGPIALVSSSSLQAAAQPAATNLFYFVSKGDGTHIFSETLEQHNAAVRQYILGQNK